MPVLDSLLASWQAYGSTLLVLGGVVVFIVAALSWINDWRDQRQADRRYAADLAKIVAGVLAEIGDTLADSHATQEEISATLAAIRDELEKEN